MNITELDSYNLDDAVKFNDHLNPRLWDNREHLRPEVRERLLEIAEDFREFLGVTDLAIQDITISGSNAAYTYTPNSDIDLHLVVDMPDNPVYRELFDAKKFQYNEQHDITIGGADVELYVQDADRPHISQGIYSLLNNDWLQVPRRVKSVVDDTSTRNKFEKVGRQIESAIKSGSLKRLTHLAEKIKRMRQTGLENHGEFGPENLAFKMLRGQGLIKQLYDARNAAKDREFSLKEKAVAPRVTYGFRTPVVVEADPVSLEEAPTLSDEEILTDFIDFCFEELELETMPVVKLRKDPQWSVVNRTFGRYIDDHNLLEVAWGQRHIMDVLRTVAHELTHRHQHERESVPGDAGETGSPWENEANARAGVLMRDYAQQHPEYFAVDDTEEVDESIKGATVAALSACIIGGGSLSGCATQQGMRPMDAARIIYNAKQYNNTVIQADVAQELNNFIRAQRGEVNAQNQSRLYQLQKQNQQKPPGPTNEGASGYIPTKKQAKDPRYSMALTVDIKPGQIGKEANKLNLKTNRQGVPQIANPNGLFEKLALELAQFKENVQAPVSKSQDEADYYKFLVAKVKQGRELTRQEKEFLRSYRMFNKQVAEKKLFALAENEQLDEVNMSPSVLAKWATSPEAKGIRAGFEAELIFRDTAKGEDSDYEMEPDYDYDERSRSISQIIEFFQNGEYGGLSQRQERTLQDGLDEQYMEWYDEQLQKDFSDEAEDLIRKVLVDEGDWDEDDEIQKQLVLLDYSDDEIRDIINAGERAPKFNSSEEQIAYAKENLLYEKYVDAQEQAEGLLDDLVADEVRKQGANWDAALDDFRDNYQIDDDSGFFDDAGLRYMSDVASEYSLDWPYMTGGGGNDGSRDWESIGASLQSIVFMPVKVSSGYHSTTRKEGQWIVEPDSSLDPDDSDDMGLEIVSPPMPLLVALEKLQAVTEWANDTSEGNAYTNNTTGLHMGVSVPYKGGDVDYLKLILFLGDEYVLQQFGRDANTYAKSAMKSFRENLKSGRADPASTMKLMQHGLLELAQREIQKGVGQSKYTSAHIQNGYIEFRSAGGDWLAEENADPAKLQNTMLRYARAMQIAADPATDRREYAKKLYKLIAPEGDSQLALFSQYAAGELDKEQLKKRWAEKTLGDEKKINQFFKLYQKVDGIWIAVPGEEYRGFQEDEVKNRVWMKYGREALDTGEYQLVNMSDNQEWEVYDVKTGETLEIVQGANKVAAADQVFDKYANQGVGFNVRPYVDPKTLTPRAKLAKRIAEPKKPTDYNYEIVNLGDVNLRVVDQFYATDKQDADKTFDKWLAIKGLPNDTNDYGYRPRKKESDQSADDRQDSRDLQARLRAPVQDIEPDVAQNFGNQFSGQWRVMLDGEEVWRFRGVGNNQGDANRIAQTWLQDQRSQGSLSPGDNAEIEVLPVMIESIDPVSGAGVRAPIMPPKLKPQPLVKPATPAIKVDTNKKKEDPLAQTYKKFVKEGTSPADTLYFFDVGRGGRSFTDSQLKAMSLRQTKSGRWYYRPGGDATDLLTSGSLKYLETTLNVPARAWQRPTTEDNLSEVDRRDALKALGAGAMAAAVPGMAQAGPFVDVTALGKSNPEQFNKVWVPRYKELTVRCQDIMRQLIAAAGPEWASLLKGSTIRVVSSENYAQASAISRTITIDLSVFWDAPTAALAFTIAHELGHIALEHATGTDDSTADYKTQVRVAAQYRQGELDADEFAVRLCKVLGYSKAEVFKFIAKNEAELQMLDALTQSPTSSHPSQRTRIERARMNGFQLSKGGIQQMNVLKQHLAEQDAEDQPTTIKLDTGNTAAQAWIDKIYANYPQTWQNNHVMPMGGSGEDQQFAMFELVPSLSKRGAVEVKWFQAYPLRAGVGSRAMQELQAMARADGISLTLFPWDKGQVSQTKLTKFYRGQGFKPTAKGGKAMQWEPK